MPIDNEVAQIYYDRALETKMHEKVPIYLMNFYNRWQSLNFTHSLIEAASDAMDEPLSRGGMLLVSQFIYFVCLVVVIKCLRNDSQREALEQN